MSIERAHRLLEQLQMACAEEPYAGAYNEEEIIRELQEMLEDELHACRCPDDSSSCEACMLVEEIRREIGLA